MSKNNEGIKVLVTGASGYLGTHVVKHLLDSGYLVRGTVRSLHNTTKVRPLYDLCADKTQLELVEADLEKPETWPKAVEGCDYVLHVASPFPIVADESVVKIAVDGTLNVLKACSKAHTVKKVVLTSSCASINEGHDDENKVFNEEDWTNVDSPKVLPYAKSKTQAERAAWDFVSKIPETENRFKLTCLNPTLIVGPLLMDTQGTSITVVRRFMSSFNEMPAVPALQLALVDVRDVAKAHVLCLSNSKTDGQRILITAQPSFWFLDIAKVLAKEFKQQGYWLPRFQVPYPILWMYSLFDSEARQILERVNRKIKFDNSKAKELLNIEFSNPEKSLVEMAYTMIERGVLPRKPGYNPSSRT